MSEVKEHILEKLFPAYNEAVRIIESYSDYELELVRYDLPDEIEDLEREVLLAVQWDISEMLLNRYINDWDDFYFENEQVIMDYLYQEPFISFDRRNNFYSISEKTVIDVCTELIEGKEYSINKDVDFREIISDLNKYYPIKFCEV